MQGDAETSCDWRRDDGRRGNSEVVFAQKGAPTSPAVPSHQADEFGTDLCCVEFRLAVGKPHDDF